MLEKSVVVIQPWRGGGIGIEHVEFEPFQVTSFDRKSCVDLFCLPLWKIATTHRPPIVRFYYWKIVIRHVHAHNGLDKVGINVDVSSRKTVQLESWFKLQVEVGDCQVLEAFKHVDALVKIDSGSIIFICYFSSIFRWLKRIKTYKSIKSIKRFTIMYSVTRAWVHFPLTDRCHLAIRSYSINVV